MFWKKKEKPVEKIVVDDRLQHIAFIMDGNGRWAKKRGMPREFGHSHGAATFKKIGRYCESIGLKYMTVYAFSTENWKRPQKEVDAIMKLVDTYLLEYERGIDEYDMQIRFIGDKTPFEPRRRANMERLERLSAHKPRTLNIALNYGGRDEIVRACNRLLEKGISAVDEQSFAAVLDTTTDPDLIVRTGGDLRISNFLLWQSAYAEFYFTDVLWPDFGAREVDAAIEEFYKRKRRFGGV